MTYVNPYAWLGDLKPGDYVRVCHSILYPNGKRVTVKRVNSKWVELEHRMRFGRVTGKVRDNNCLFIHPWKEKTT